MADVGWSSRKYRTAWYLTILTTLVTLAPAVGDLFKIDIDVVVDGYQWLTFLAVLWGAYMGFNVAEKHNIFNRSSDKVEEKEVRLTKKDVYNNPDEEE